MNSTPRTRPVSLLLAILLAVVPTGQQSRGEEPQSASVRAFQSAAALYDSGKVAEALTALHSFEAQYQFSAAVPQAIYLQGLCWARLHKCREAINTFERLRKGYGSAPVIPEAILKQAECNQELKNYPTALELYREFESTYPRHRLLSQAVLGEAWANLQQGDAAAAQAILQRALTQFADDPGTILRVRLLTGQVLTAEKRYDEAFQVYKNVTTEEYDSRASDAFFLAGESFFDAGRWTEAIECYRRVQPRAALIAHLQEQIEALENRQTNSVRQAAVAASEHEINDLRERLTRCEDGPDFGASALYRIASCHESLGHINQALAAYSQFLSRYPTDKVSEEARVGLIRTLVAGRQFADAVAAATDFQARYPSSSFGADVSLLEAEALLASGKTTEALVRFEKLAATNPPLPILETVEFHIGACYYSLREFDRARDSFQAFVRDHPDSAIVPDALFRLGRCYVELAQDMTDSAVVSTNLTAAVATYEQLRELYPTNATIREVTFQLGYLNASLASGDRDSAGDSASKICHADAVKFFGEFVNRWADDALVPEAMYQLGRNEYALGRFDDAL
ncbi:MAG TPA: tetratricopeptide repeat protein, partial [Verrucomicrobiae bacterium]|nr:tetratricopeptide repeat protein [Verrucomicrobiae bacterium]